ncbi:phospho-N-acetylmuramoyl-pentapeptide-transferase [Alkalinema pantanalense CENA528]|uniref:phospho-N-acetylmuramoyl-pentapeptide- transferase n=1 Tax=Alkalinema pantanalense TaxID=1620705 RepID=UPI003D6F2F2B
MDAKLFTSQSFSFSGTRLFLFLTGGLTGSAMLLDLWAGRSFIQGASLTLPLVLCAVVTALVGYLAVPLLRSLKAGQIIREDGPKAHLKKAGTPTMGGAFFVPVAVIAAVLWSGFAPKVLAVSALTLAYFAIGFLDDWKIIRKKSNKGISPRMKMGLQIGGAVLFCLWMLLTQSPDLTRIALPIGSGLSLGALFWVVAGFVMVAESNATNLTDGVDGLAGGTVAISLLGLGAIAGLEGSHYAPELMIFCACMSGSCLGFLVHNRNPAKVFMGDTGSLALGGALAAVALLTNSLFALLIVSGLFLWETISVIIQVSYYKATKNADGVGQRFFKMSPYHNHLELSGWTETQIVGWFYAVNAFLVMLSMALL